MKEKDLNFLVTYSDPFTAGTKSYIVKAKDKKEVEEILKENDSQEHEVYSSCEIKLLSSVERLSRKELSIRQVMEMISNPEHFSESVKLLEKMLVDNKMHYDVLRLILSPYLEFVEKQKIIDPVKTNKTLWMDALTSVQDKRALRIVLQYLPKNKKPFSHQSQTYDIWVEKEGSFKDLTKKLTFKRLKHINGSLIQNGTYTMCQLFTEMRKIIPDLPTRIEQRIIEIM